MHNIWRINWLDLLYHLKKEIKHPEKSQSLPVEQRINQRYSVRQCSSIQLLAFPTQNFSAECDWMLMALRDLQAHSRPPSQGATLHSSTSILSCSQHTRYEMRGGSVLCHSFSKEKPWFGGRFTLLQQWESITTDVLFCHVAELFISQFSQKESGSL